MGGCNRNGCEESGRDASDCGVITYFRASREDRREMADENPAPKIEIELPGEDPEPPEYEQRVAFGEAFREQFAAYDWTLGTLAGIDGETVEVPSLPTCIDAAFRVHVAGTLASADFPDEVYDVPDADADFAVTDQDLGEAEVAVTVTATPRGGPARRTVEAPASGVDEHWHVDLQYDLDDGAVVTAEAVTNPSITVAKL